MFIGVLNKQTFNRHTRQLFLAHKSNIIKRCIIILQISLINLVSELIMTVIEAISVSYILYFMFSFSSLNVWCLFILSTTWSVTLTLPLFIYTPSWRTEPPQSVNIRIVCYPVESVDEQNLHFLLQTVTLTVKTTDFYSHVQLHESLPARLAASRLAS